MVALDVIQDGVNRAKLYNLSEFSKLRARIKKGERHCSFGDLICIRRWINALTYDIAQNFNDEDTQAIYKLLMMGIHGFGGSYQLDPNVNIPGRNVTIIIDGDDRPDWIDVFWADMEDNGEDQRLVYYNPLLIGLNPMIQKEGVTMYQVEVDYENNGLGTITFNAGKGFFDGEYFRMGNYQEYIPTPVTDGYITHDYIEEDYIV